MTENAQPDPAAQDGAAPQAETGTKEVLILSNKGASKPKGNARNPGCRVERPGMAFLNVANTKLLGEVAGKRGLSSSTPPAVQVGRGDMDIYYLIPLETVSDEVSEVKYGKGNTSCRVDLYSYLEQSKLLVPADVHWWVPARYDNESKYGHAILLDFSQRELLTIHKRGPKKAPPPPNSTPPG